MIDNRPRKTDRRVMSPRERLDTYAERDDNGCLIFTRGGSATQYPMIWVGGKKMTTSRAQWTVTFGEPPANIVVRHRCDVRNCIELSHLVLGTHKQNTADMYDRNRSGARINREVADSIRSFVAKGNTQKDAATVFGLSKQQVSNIVNRKSWNG